MSSTMVVEDEVFQQVQEVLFLTDTSEHRGQFDVASFLFRQSFPLVEELPLRVYGTHTCLQSVAEHDEGIMVEQLRNRIEIVTIILIEGIHHFHVVVLQFHKQQRQPIHEAHNVGPAMI